MPKGSMKEHIQYIMKESIMAAMWKTGDNMNKFDVSSDEYRIYKILEEGYQQQGKNDDLNFNIGSYKQYPSSRGCIKKNDGWHYYAFDDYVHQFEEIGPIRDLATFICILSIKLNVDLEGYQITRDVIFEMQNATHR